MVLLSRQEKIQLARQMVSEPLKDTHTDKAAPDWGEMEGKKSFQGFFIRLALSMLIGIGCYMANSKEEQPVWYQQLKQQKTYLEQSIDYHSVEDTLRDKYVSIVEQYTK